MSELPRGPASNDDREFNSVLAEIWQLQDEKKKPDLRRYLESFPHLRGRLLEHFQNVGWWTEEVAHLFDSPRPAAGSKPANESTDPDSATRTQREIDTWPNIPGYLIEKELGRGGMGIVYQARQLKPDRPVALKVIRMDRLEYLPIEERRQWLDRFQREVQLVATLDRPEHIVSLYEVGEHAGQPYFTMRLVTGGTLAARLQQTAKREPGQAQTERVRRQRGYAHLLASVSRAVHYAHQRGVLHRDLKPANILLDEEGQPLVSDFGLARRVDQTGSLVESGIEGTVEYMAPEQARAVPGAATMAADVYSLGAILYECLIGRPPFQGKNVWETLMLVIGQEPAPPRSLNPRVPRDLEIICLKCLNKEAGRRYSAAADLAEDLDNYCAGRPINARPAGAVERAWRFCRRYPVPSAAALIVFVTLVTAIPMTLWSRANALRLADEKDHLARSEKAEKEKATLSAAQRDAAAHDAETQRDANAVQLSLAALDQGHRSCRRGDLALGLLQFARAQQVAPAAEDELRRAGRANLAAWRGRFRALLAALPHEDEVLAVGFSRDGKLLVTGGRDEKARLWDSATGRPVGAPLIHLGRAPGLPAVPEKVGGRGGQVVAVALGPDGKTLATGTADPYHKGREQVWAAGLMSVLRTGDHPKVIDANLGGDFGSSLFDPFPAQIWAVGDGRLVRRPRDRATVWAVAFSPDGKILLTAEGQITGEDLTRPPIYDLVRGRQGSGGAARLWQWADGKQLGQAMRHNDAVLAVSFSPDGKRIATGSVDRTARLWVAKTGAPLCDPIEHDGPVVAAAFSPDGRLLLTASYAGQQGTVRLWDLASGRQLGPPLRPTLPVLAAAFSPDGRTILAGCGDPTFHKGEAVFWDVATGQLIGDPIPHPGPVQAVAYSPDGLSVLTACTDRIARLWEANIGPVTQPLARYEEALAFSADGQQALCGGGARQPRLCAASTGAPAGPLIGPEKQAREAYLSADGRFILTLWPSTPQNLHIASNAARLWDAATGQALGSELKLPHEIAAVAISPDGQRILTSHVSPYHHDGDVSIAQLWDVTNGKAIGKALPLKGPIRALAFSPDGREAVVASDDHTARLCDGTSGLPVGEVLAHKGPIRAVAFSSDGRLVLTGSDDYTARLWEAATGKPLGEPLSMRGEVRAVAFSPDGRYAATGSEDGTARVWETATRRPVGLLLEHDGPVSAIAFSPDGRLVLTGSLDRTARLWVASTGGPVGVPLPHRGPVLAVCFGAKGRTGLTRSHDRAGAALVLQRVGSEWERPVGGSWDSTASVWPLPDASDGTPEQVTRRVQALTGMELDTEGVLRPLETDAWEKRRREARHEPPGLPAEEPLAWHRREAAAAAAYRQPFAARWHLDRLVEAEGEQANHRLSRCRALAALGEFDAALSDASKAIELGRGEDYGAWLHRGEVHRLRGQWELAIKDFSKALVYRPKDPGILHQRGQAHAELAQWQEAADDLRKAAVLPGAPIDVLEHLALVCLARHDTDGYRKACEALMNGLPMLQPSFKGTVYKYEDFGRLAGTTYQEGGVQTVTTFDYAGLGPARTITQRGNETGGARLAAVCARLAWVCSLAPGAPGMERVQSAAAELVRFNDKEYSYSRSLGAALYRSAHYEDAVKELTRALTLRKQSSPSAWLLLAMAQQRCQRKDQAIELLRRAREWMVKARKAKPGGAGKDELDWGRLPWAERLSLELLEAEAVKLIENESPKK
jgi:WD40 repeat protein/tetratricopeptide (TPR) repeat protein